MPRQLDEDYTILHLQDEQRAMAQRVMNMAEEVNELSANSRVLAERQLRRDDVIANIQERIDGILEAVKALQKTQLNEEQAAVIKTILLGKDRNDWLKNKSKYYFWGALSFMGAVYLMRDWIRIALVAMGIIKP